MADWEESVHADGIQWVLDNGIMRGFNDGTFRPSYGLTRGQFATTLKQFYDWATEPIEEPVDPPVEPPVEPPLTPPVDLTPMGSIYHADGKTHRYENVFITGRVTASGAGTRIEIVNFEIDADGHPYAVAGHTGSSPNDGVFLENGVVNGGEDGFKNSVSTKFVTVQNLSRKYREGTGVTPHGDCHQMEGSAYATHKSSIFKARWREDNEMANACFMLKTERDGANQTIIVEDCLMEGGNYVVFLRDDHGFGEICDASFILCEMVDGAWRYGPRSVTSGYDFNVWDVQYI